MGDICDHNDLVRFMRSPEGQQSLLDWRRTLRGRTVAGVEFSNEIHAIAMTLHLDNGEAVVLYHPSLEVEAIRDEFRSVLEREYRRDYPDRAPSIHST